MVIKITDGCPLSPYPNSFDRTFKFIKGVNISVTTSNLYFIFSNLKIFVNFHIDQEQEMVNGRVKTEERRLELYE